MEAYNCVLGKRINKHGHFFRFANSIIEEEFMKSNEFVNAIESGGASNPKKRKIHKDRSDTIEEAFKELEKRKLTSMEFLNRITYPQNKICSNMLDTIFSDSDDDNDEEHFVPPAPAKLLCILCHDVPVDTMFQPCHHVKTCNICYLKLLAEALGSGGDTAKCPTCNSDIEDVISVYL